jgi:Spy/CpxP family protein refolding chaperone
MKFMKSTKTFLITALAASALIVGSSPLRAQDSTNIPPVGAHGKGRVDIVKALDLTDDQKPKVREILKDAADKRKAVREDDSLSADDKKAKVKAIQDDATAKLKAILTPDQFAKYQTLTKKAPRHSGLAAPNTPAPSAAPPQS